MTRINAPGSERATWRSTIQALSGAAAFTLVEMLVVLAVIGILLGMTLPLFKNMLGGRAVEQSINGVSGIIELGRASAVSNHTYVWVLFKNVTNSDNNLELRCAAVMSLNGTNSSEAINCAPITRLVKVQNVKSVKFSEMPMSVKKVTPLDLADDKVYVTEGTGAADSPIFPSFVVGGQDFKGAAFIRFDGDGEIATSLDRYNLMVQPIIALGLAAARGTVVQANANDGAIVAVNGGTARMRIIRP